MIKLCGWLGIHSPQHDREGRAHNRWVILWALLKGALAR